MLQTRLSFLFYRCNASEVRKRQVTLTCVPLIRECVVKLMLLAQPYIIFTYILLFFLFFLQNKTLKASNKLLCSKSCIYRGGLVLKNFHFLHSGDFFLRQFMVEISLYERKRAVRLTGLLCCSQVYMNL